jgi:hypothetical protein
MTVTIALAGKGGLENNHLVMGLNTWLKLCRIDPGDRRDPSSNLNMVLGLEMD